MTIDYYNQNAETYIERTQNFDVSHAYKAFIPLLSPKCKILDLGCGSGRDSLYFQKLGFDVLAIDAADAFVQHVQKLGIRVQKMWMEEIAFEEEFDAVWCCASLVHVQKEHLSSVLQRIHKSLKADGIAYFSFKAGEEEGFEEGRYFHYMTQEKLEKYLQQFEQIAYWEQFSSRNKTPTVWINVIVRKKTSGNYSSE